MRQEETTEPGGQRPPSSLYWWLVTSVSTWLTHRRDGVGGRGAGPLGPLLAPGWGWGLVGETQAPCSAVCPGLLSIDVINTRIKAPCGGEGSCQLTVPQNNQREVNTGTQDRNGSGGHGGTPLTGLLPLAGSAASLIQPRTTCPEMALPPIS